MLLGADVEVIESFDIKPPTQNYIEYKQYKAINRVKKKVKKYHYKKKNIKKTDKVTLLKANKTQINKNAKLVIIIDDISHRYQLNQILSLPFKVTPSIFPPNKMNRHSNLLAKGLKHFMVHLPLESNSRAMNRMYKTIFTNYSQKQINNRIKEIRRLFPTAKYINNHTGSKFTSNYSASKKLYKALIKNGFIFVDSRTSWHTKIPIIAKEFHKRYIKNDFFIDNLITVKSIKRQIKRAVDYAKRYGLAIVIGHPHPQTIKALKESAKIINSVKTVYIDEI